MLKIGDIVLCRFYNTPDKHFYGDYWQGQIMDIRKERLNSFWFPGKFYESSDSKEYYIKSDNNSLSFWMKRKEIKRIIKAA